MFSPINIIVYISILAFIYQGAAIFTLFNYAQFYAPLKVTLTDSTLNNLEKCILHDIWSHMLRHDCYIYDHDRTEVAFRNIDRPDDFTIFKITDMKGLTEFLDNYSTHIIMTALYEQFFWMCAWASIILIYAIWRIRNSRNPEQDIFLSE